jgi:hypothetical protein
MRWFRVELKETGIGNKYIYMYRMIRRAAAAQVRLYKYKYTVKLEIRANDV